MFTPVIRESTTARQTVSCAVERYLLHAVKTQHMNNFPHHFSLDGLLRRCYNFHDFPFLLQLLPLLPTLLLLLLLFYYYNHQFCTIVYATAITFIATTNATYNTTSTTTTYSILFIVPLLLLLLLLLQILLITLLLIVLLMLPLRYIYIYIYIYYA